MADDMAAIRDAIEQLRACDTKALKRKLLPRQDGFDAKPVEDLLQAASERLAAQRVSVEQTRAISDIVSALKGTCCASPTLVSRRDACFTSCVTAPCCAVPDTPPPAIVASAISGIAHARSQSTTTEMVKAHKPAAQLLKASRAWKDAWQHANRVHTMPLDASKEQLDAIAVLCVPDSALADQPAWPSDLHARLASRFAAICERQATILTRGLSCKSMKEAKMCVTSPAMPCCT